MRRGPIGGNEINTPEMRRGREEFDADALAFVGGITKKNDTALLLFLCEWIGDNENGIEGEGLIQIHQSAVRVDHDGFAGFAESAIVGILSGNHDAYPQEDSRTAARFIVIVFGHRESMLLHFHRGVNECVK